MFNLDKISKFALALIMVFVPCIAQGPPPTALAQWSFMTDLGPVKSADPIARVFGDRLYVYTATDHGFNCGPQNSVPLKREGSGKFCMLGYRVFSTSDAGLTADWISHGFILADIEVPWAHKPPGFKSSGRMFSPDVVQVGKIYNLFFSAPQAAGGNVIGVATSSTPTGKFVAAKQPIKGTTGIEASVIRLTNGRYVLFTSTKGVVHVQTLNGDFTEAGKKTVVTGLLKEQPTINKQGLFTEYRAGKLYLYYTASYEGGYKIHQAVAKDPTNPAAGFWDINVVIDSFDRLGRNNKASMVTFKGASWAFYHRHVAIPTAKWHTRRVAFSPMQFWCDGKAQPMTPPTL